MQSRVRWACVLALGLMFGVSAVMRADTVFSSFGPGQSYPTNSYVDVGNGGAGNQVVTFSFVPSETVLLSNVDMALNEIGAASPLMVSLWFNTDGEPGNAIDPLTQVGTFSSPGVVTFTCGNMYAVCPVLQAGETYWIVAQQSDASNLSYWFFSPIDTGTWYYDETGNAGGPWTTATLSDSIGAFDVNGTPVPTETPEPASLVLLGSAMVAVIAGGTRLSRRR